MFGGSEANMSATVSVGSPVSSVASSGACTSIGDVSCSEAVKMVVVEGASGSGSVAVEIGFFDRTRGGCRGGWWLEVGGTWGGYRGGWWLEGGGGGERVFHRTRGGCRGGWWVGVSGGRERVVRGGTDGHRIGLTVAAMQRKMPDGWKRSCYPLLNTRNKGPTSQG